MKKFFAIILVVCSFFSVYTAQAAINADPEFRSASITLTSGKLAVYSANLYDEKESISVVSADLYQKINGDWEYVCSLPVPAFVGENTELYGASISYASYIGTGTYRVTATFSADGYEITRNSNERTF